MAQYTYKDLLDALGLQNWQFILLTLVGMALWPLVASLWKMKLVGKVEVNRVKLSAFKCVYISYEGRYSDIGLIYSQSVQDFRMVFKLSNFFVIYYDESSKQTSQPLSKAIIGVTVKNIEESKIDLFISKFPQYKKSQFPVTECLCSVLPLSNLSPIMATNRVYPAMEAHLQKFRIQLEHKQFIEVYHQNDPSTSMSVLLPIENQLDFQKWYEPTDYSRVQPKK